MTWTSASLSGLALATLDSDDWMHAFYLTILLAFIASSSLVIRSDRWKNLRALAAWAGIAALLILIYAFKEDAGVVWQRFRSALVPGYAGETAGELSISRGRDGMFSVEAEVNGKPTRLIFDTGASTVLLTAEDAANAGLAPSESSYWVKVTTANGETEAAPVTIAELRVGSLVARDVRALVARPGSASDSLLGHSFLDTLKSYEVRGDRLIIRYD